MPAAVATGDADAAGAQDGGSDAAATPTVTGTYHVYLKYETQTMRGQNADGSNYVTEGVPWVTYWYQGYALHGAPWRSSFGFSGSHGCVNMNEADAKWIYDNCPDGTLVQVVGAQPTAPVR